MEWEISTKIVLEEKTSKICRNKWVYKRQTETRI